jgi:lipoprotein-anchoring transpeptidase ErfK/SrfK
MALAGLMVTTMVACTPKSGARSDEGAGAGSAAQDAGPQAVVAVTAPAANAVGVEPLATIAFTVQNADRPQVEVTDANGSAVKGKTAADGRSWQPVKAFAWGRAYMATVTATAPGGTSTTATSSFTIKKKPTKVVRISSPFSDGQTWGVGMVMVLKFGRAIPEKYRAGIEKRITVESTPKQQGSWNWFAQDELHYRPKVYWKAGTTIGYDARLTGVPMGGSWYGNADRSFTGTIGRSLIITVDDRAKSMTVTEDGVIVRTIPVSLGASRTPSSSGTHLIMTRERHARFNTMGAQDPRDRYDIPVEYAQRLTWGGEYIHAAGWSEPSQGKVNVSHGCINVSVKNAAWLFDHTLIGDPVTTKGTPRTVQHGNGYTDWNSSWDDYRSGSALH